MNGTQDTSSGAFPGNSDGMPPRVHVYDYLLVFGRYRRLFISIVLGGCILVAGYLMIARQTFTSSATLLPPDKSEGLSLSALMASSSKLDFKALSENSSAETFVRMVQSRTIADSLITRFNLLKRFQIPESDRELAIDEVLGNFTVTSDRQGFIDISYDVRTGYFPDDTEQRDAAKHSAEVLNATIELLDKMNQRKSISRARRSREFIGRMKLIKRAELDSVQADLLRFQQQHKALALDKQVEASVEGSMELQTLIQKAEISLAGLRLELSEDAPAVQALAKQLAELKAQRTRLEGGRAGSEALGIPLKGMPQLMREYANLKLRMEVVTQIYSYLEAQYNQEQIQEARELPTVNVLDYATPPVRRSAPRRVLMLAIAFMGFVVLATVVIFVLDTYRRSWADVDSSQRQRLRGVFGLKPKQPTTTESAG